MKLTNPIEIINHSIQINSRNEYSLHITTKERLNPKNITYLYTSEEIPKFHYINLYYSIDLWNDYILKSYKNLTTNFKIFNILRDTYGNLIINTDRYNKFLIVKR